MESGKTKHANLEDKKGIFLRIGFILALAAILLAFEWRTSDKRLSTLNVSAWEPLDELLPINTDQRKPPPPPVPKQIYTINIVDKPDLISDDFPRIDASFNEDWANPDFVKLQDEPSDPAEDTIFNTFSLARQPEFPGGETALYEFLRENIRYPRIAIEANIQGMVYISFVVEKDGTLSNINIIRSPDPYLSDEAVRVVSLMPAWSPGKQREKPVRVCFNLPVRFKLQ